MRTVILVAFSLACFCSFAEDVQIKYKGSSSLDRLEVPVDVDLTGGMLNINLTDYGHMTRFYAHVIVTGPEGVVFEADISSDNRPAIIVDLNKYIKGGYTVTFYDHDGNVLTGDFLLE